MEIHPLRRFDLAVAVLLRRPSLVTSVDISELPESDFRSETVRAYVDLRAQRIEGRPGKAWPQLDFDIPHSTLTFWANARKFRVELSWRGDGWELRSRGKLADRRDPLAYAAQWAISGSAKTLPKSVQEDGEKMFRVVQALLQAEMGVDDFKSLCLPVNGAPNSPWTHAGLNTFRVPGHRLFIRPATTPM